MLGEIRGNTWSPEISTLVSAAIKACELRRMAFPDDDPPFPSADLDRHPVGKPLKARRHRWDTAAVAFLPLAEELSFRVVETGAAREIAPHRGEILGSMAHHPSGQPFLLGDPQWHLPTLGHPIGEPHVVRVVMRHDDPSDRHSAEPLGKDPFPQLPGLGHGIPGVDDRPARTVFEQPQIDMVEREGEGHAQPLHARGDRQRLAGPGRRRNRKLQRGHASVHNSGFSRLAN